MIVTTIGTRTTSYSMEEAKNTKLSEYIRGKRCTIENKSAESTNTDVEKPKQLL